MEQAGNTALLLNTRVIIKLPQSIREYISSEIIHTGYNTRKVSALTRIASRHNDQKTELIRNSRFMRSMGEKVCAFQGYFLIYLTSLIPGAQQ